MIGRLGCVSFHPALQDQDRGHAVDGLATFFDREIGLAQEAVGFGGGEPLVPEVHRKFEMLAKIVGEGLDLFGLDARGAAHAQGKTDDDFFD